MTSGPGPWASTTVAATVTPAGTTLVSTSGTAANSLLLNGYGDTTAATANTIARRDASAGLTVAAFSATTGTFSGGTVSINGGTNPWLGLNNGSQYYLEVNGSKLGLSVPGHVIALNVDTSGNTNVAVALNVTGLSTLTGGLKVGSMAFLTGGSMGLNSGSGLCLWGNAGSTYDFSILDPTNAAYYMRVPTGTNVPVFPQGSTASGLATFNGNVALGAGARVDGASYIAINPAAGERVLLAWHTGIATVFGNGAGSEVGRVSNAGLGTFQGGLSISTSTGLLIADGAPGVTTGKLYSITTNSLMWSGSTVLTTGNVGTNAATFQAAVASASAPLVGTTAQRTAYTPAAGTTPYWYATDEAAPDGLLGSLRHWTGSAWGAAANPLTVVGRVVAGVISAGAIGAQAIAADVALIGQVLRNTGYTAGVINGTTNAAPSGFKLSGTDYTANCFNGYITGAVGSGPTQPSVTAEFGSGVSIGGYDVSSLALARLVNGGSVAWATPGTYLWTCPPGITQAEIVVVGAGSGGASQDSTHKGCGGGGGTLVAVVTVTPGAVYTCVLGAGGIGVVTGPSGVGGASSITGTGVTATCNGGGAANGGGATGASGSVVLNGDTLCASVAGASSGNAPAANTESGVLFAYANSGGGGAQQLNGTYYSSSSGVSYFPASNIQGGASAMSKGAAMAALPVKAGIGGGGGAASGVNTGGGYGGDGYIRIRF